LVTACSRDKDVAAIVAAWAPHFARVVVTRYLENPRAVDPQELADVWRNASGADVIVCDSPAPALAEAQRLAAPGELVVISGSFFIAAELRPLALQSGRE
jgi:dihydrofolate synthase/folylpolyglutamate synthase